MKFVLFTALIVTGYNIFAQEYEYDRVFFSNSLINGRYFYSNTRYKGASWIKNSQNKLWVNTDHWFTPGNSLELTYTSARGGHWEAIVIFPEWRGKDFFKPAEALRFFLYMDSHTKPDQLPQISVGLADSTYSDPVPIARYLKNSNAKNWSEVFIPLREFSNITSEKTKQITFVKFAQAGEDGENHNVFIDEIEIAQNELPILAEQTTPSLLSAKGYERHIDLIFETPLPESVKYIKIYRSEDGKTFESVGIQHPWYFRFTDYIGEVNKRLWYKITYVDHRFQESGFSNVMETSTRKMSDEELLTMVQEASFRYYWEGAEPNSGLALENIPGRTNMIATGASGFGIMAIVVGVARGFVTRDQAVVRLLKITDFLERADKFHGAVSHFIDGRSGKAVPFFGPVDNGGDLVETSFLMQGLLVARQYFDRLDPKEKMIRDRITKLWNGVEWNWYRKEQNSNYLYWHWSREHTWKINHKLIGFNETMITYLLAIASPTHGVPADLYYSGFASQSQEAQQYRANWGQTKEGSMYTNGTSYFGIKLDVGVSRGGPIFFTHYSYFALDPHALTDRYTNYFENNRSICLINHRYCVENPKQFDDYGTGAWGLTGSDGPWGYSAHEPSLHGDSGTLTPTGAVASIVYTPEESLSAIKNYYFKHGHFLWGEYGFRDAYNLSANWCAPIYMGLNQAPMTVMIENYRSGLIWKTFMKDPDIQAMVKKVFSR